MGRTSSLSENARSLNKLAQAVDEEMVQGIAEGMLEAMSEGLPDIEFDGDLAADALAASREAAGGFLWGIDAEPWIVPPVPPALSDLARTLARRGVDLTVLIKLTRLGQSVFWPAVMESAERSIQDPAVRMRVLTTTFERFSLYLEGLLDGTVAIFLEERDRNMRGAHARRYETIQALIKGQDLDIDGASRALGYELRRFHTALALSAPDGGQDALGQLESLARAIAAAVDSGSIVTTASGSRGLWAWIGTTALLTCEQVTRVSAVPVPPGAHAAVGAAAPGMAGFRRSHEEALAAQRVALAIEDAPPITMYADVEIASLLSHDIHAARALVARELAGLTGKDKQSAKLRQTVLAFLRCGGSATAAARDIDVHTNTVRYRIEQAEEMLGHTLQGQQLQLQLALMLVETLGAGILPESP
jgi:PucR-like helix-turn-helix protein/diguanylate cyclase with GGDEF domain